MQGNNCTVGPSSAAEAASPEWDAQGDSQCAAEEVSQTDAWEPPQVDEWAASNSAIASCVDDLWPEPQRMPSMALPAADDSWPEQWMSSVALPAADDSCPEPQYMSSVAFQESDDSDEEEYDDDDEDECDETAEYIDGID